MKTLKCLMIVMGIFFTASLVLPVWGLNPQPEPPMDKLTLPQGTTVEKIGAGHFKFKLPDGRTVEVKGLQKSRGGTAIIGDSGIYDRTGKLIASRKQGILKSGPKPTPIKGQFPKVDKVESKNFVKIDDDVTWFPITIQFQKVETKRKVEDHK